MQTIKAKLPTKEQLTTALKLVVKVASIPAVKKLLQRLTDKNTTLGKTVRTWLQAIIGITGFVMAVVDIPGFYSIFTSSPLVTVISASTFVAIVTLLHNGAESTKKYLETEE